MRFAKYQETKDFLLHKTQPHPLVAEFADWFFQEYSAKLLNIDIYAFDPDDQGIRHYWLLIIVETRVNDFEGTNLPAEVIFNIKNKFVELSTKHNFANEHKINNKSNYIQRTTKRNFPQIKNLENISNVTLYIFSKEARRTIAEGTLDEATIFLKGKYPEIFRLQVWNPLAIIYHTDTQIFENKNNGKNEKIMNDYFEFIKNYDELNFFTEPITGVFVSQETLDRSFMGQLYYYFK